MPRLQHATRSSGKRNASPPASWGYFTNQIPFGLIYIYIDICFPKTWYQTNSKMHVEISTNVLLQAIPVWLVNSKRSRFIDDFPLNCQAFLNKRRFLLEWDSPKTILDWDFPQPSSYRGYPQFRKPPKLKRTHWIGRSRGRVLGSIFLSWVPCKRKLLAHRYMKCI